MAVRRLRFPSIRIQVDWQDVQSPVRAGLVAFALILTVVTAAVLVRDAPGIWGEARATVEAYQARPLPRDWRAPPRELGLDSMYGPRAKAPSVEHMYAKPRPLPKH